MNYKQSHYVELFLSDLEKEADASLWCKRFEFWIKNKVRKEG